MRQGRLTRRCQACGRDTTAKRCTCGSDRVAWSFTVDISRPGEPRKQVHRSGFATRAAAVEAKARIQDQAARDEPEPTKMTVSQWLDQWLPSRRGQITGSTLSSYRMMARCYVVPAIGTVPLRQVTKARLRLLYTDLVEKGGRRGQGLSQKSVHNVAVMLVKVFGDAIEDRLLPGPNPAERAHRPRRARRDMHVWTADQVREFLDYVEDDRHSCLWRVASSTGMRRGELLGLRWVDVDFGGNALSVQQTWIRGAEGLTFGGPKTAHGRRRIALDPVTVSALKAHKRAQASERLRAGSLWVGHDLVFPHEDGSPLDPDVVSESFKRSAIKAGLPVIRFHDIRHTHATILLLAGVHPKVVSERLGHSSVATTLDIYSHVVRGLQEDAAVRFATAIDQPAGEGAQHDLG
jgi:integrase